MALAWGVLTTDEWATMDVDGWAAMLVDAPTVTVTVILEVGAGAILGQDRGGGMIEYAGAGAVLDLVRD